MPSWWELGMSMMAMPPYHNSQANNPYFGSKKSRNNWDQKKAAFKARVAKRRAAKKRNK